jgi:hypothetical protein
VSAENRTLTQLIFLIKIAAHTSTILSKAAEPITAEYKNLIDWEQEVAVTLLSCGIHLNLGKLSFQPISQCFLVVGTIISPLTLLSLTRAL